MAMNFTWVNDPPVAQVNRAEARQLAQAFDQQMRQLAEGSDPADGDTARMAGGIARAMGGGSEWWVYRFAFQPGAAAVQGIAGMVELDFDYDDQVPHIAYMGCSYWLSGTGGILTEAAVRRSFEEGGNGRVTVCTGNPIATRAFEGLGFVPVANGGYLSHELRPQQSQRWIRRNGTYVLDGVGRYLAGVQDT